MPASSPVWYWVCARLIALRRELRSMTSQPKSMMPAGCSGPYDHRSRARGRSTARRLAQRIRVWQTSRFQWNPLVLNSTARYRPVFSWSRTSRRPLAWQIASPSCCKQSDQERRRVQSPERVSGYLRSAPSGTGSLNGESTQEDTRFGCLVWLVSCIERCLRNIRSTMRRRNSLRW